MFLALLTISLQWMNYASWIILAALFVVDATVTLLRRMLFGQKWMTAHRTHTYQNLARYWGKHYKVTVLFISVNLLWLFPLALLSLLYPLQSIWLAVIAYVPLILVAYQLNAGKPED
jgi:Fuc2NAc and GlcNAc transferase